MAFKAHFFKTLAPWAGRLPPSWMGKLGRERLLMPFYHAVAPAPLPHIKHLYRSKTVEVFEREVDECLKYYRPIRVEEVYELRRLNKEPDSPAILFTFDDGLREVYDWIAPILLERGLTAIFFVNSAFVDNRGLFFRYQASLLVERLLQGQDAAQWKRVGEWARAHKLDTTDLARSPLQVGYHHRHALGELAELLSLDFEDFLSQYQPYLTQAQLHGLVQQGFHLGAHSVDHPLYAQLSAEEQWQQTRDSLQYVNDYFKPSLRLFSFPFTDHGVSPALLSRLLDGPQAPADLVFGCAGLQAGYAPRHLQRIPMEVGNFSAREVLHAEYLYSFAKRLATFGFPKKYGHG